MNQMKADAKQELWDVDNEMSIKQSENVPAPKMVPVTTVKFLQASLF